MRNRVFPAFFTSGILVATLGLSGCTIAPSDECETFTSTGALVKNISVTGEFGKEPNVKIPNGFTVAGPQSLTIASTSTAKKLNVNDAVVSINYALYDSLTGEEFEASGSFESDSGTAFVPVIQDASQGSFLDSLKCAVPGDRILVGFSPEEAAPIVSSLNLPKETNIIGLVDVHDVTPMNLEGSAKTLPSGFPGVVSNADGQPGVVLVPGAAPTTVKQATRIAGSGKTIEPEDDVIANILEVSWEGELFENTWATSGPISLGNDSTGGEQIRSVLNGAVVGSEMVYIVPTSEGNANIVVVDILAAG